MNRAWSRGLDNWIVRFRIECRGDARISSKELWANLCALTIAGVPVFSDGMGFMNGAGRGDGSWSDPRHRKDGFGTGYSNAWHDVLGHGSTPEGLR